MSRGRHSGRLVDLKQPIQLPVQRTDYHCDDQITSVYLLIDSSILGTDSN